MPRLQCPIEGCDWQSQDLDTAFAAGLTAALQIHDRTIHSTPAPVAPQRLQLDPPTIAAGWDILTSGQHSPDSGTCIRSGWQLLTMSCLLPYSTAVIQIYKQT
ncbi:hypothetical protein DPMN_024243 [Dreissena polymorpha]|uniref:Uncharacterized protein n=1 Tax=Dreissena polymorpha TaxID=45954 RepID=A0A9D4RAL6_DREPO|nr:hypothetical protein DPMN_024243 [Dreissena polymorpha]